MVSPCIGPEVLWLLRLDGEPRDQKRPEDVQQPLEPVRFITQTVTDQIPRVTGTATYLAADHGQTPSALENNLATHHVLHDQLIVVSVRIVDTARISATRRATVHDIGHGVLQVLLQFGFMQQPNIPRALARTLPEPLRATLDTAIYVVGLETIAPTADIPGMALWRERLFALLHRNAASVVRYFGLPRDRIVEVGTIVDI